MVCEQQPDPEKPATRELTLVESPYGFAWAARPASGSIPFRVSFLRESRPSRLCNSRLMSTTANITTSECAMHANHIGKKKPGGSGCRPRSDGPDRIRLITIVG